MRLGLFIGFLHVVLGSSLHAADEPALTGSAAKLFEQARSGRFFADAAKLKPQILPTSDGRSFLAVWKSVPEPKRWIVSLHGTHGFATDDLALWRPHLEGRDVGIVCVQWWYGAGDGPADYVTPAQIYRELDQVLPKLGVKSGTAMLHGFSRGSANSYALTALDHGKGHQYFTLTVASSGGVGLDYPPTRDITSGAYGKRPLEGSRWITCAGARDPNPDRDGIAGMRRTTQWLKEQGATVVESIEDSNAGHGAFMQNRGNTRRALDLLFRAL